MTTPSGQLRGFHHVALVAKDFDASLAFYTQGLGCTVTITWGEGDGRAVMLDTGNGNYMEIFAGGAELRPEGALLHIAFRTDNCDAAFQRAIAAGAVVMNEPSDVTIPSQPAPTPVRIAFCKGPDGEIVEFFQSSAFA